MNTVCFKEGILAGYRYYLAKNVDPQFPFGYGLSYTSFKNSDLEVTKKDGSLIVKFEVTNTGNRYGANVAQLYIHPQTPSVERPIRELKGFQKVFLKSGETTLVSLILNSIDFAF